MEIVSAIISPIVDSLMVPVKKQLGYLFSSTKHVRNMNTKMKQLDGKSSDVKKHMDANNISNLEIPSRVPGWLEEVEKTKEKAESISSTSNGCFNMKMRYRAGKNAIKITEDIESLIKENLEMVWSDAKIPLGKVMSSTASTSTTLDGDAQNHFKSREKYFKDAFESLQENNPIKVIFLCGMGGVGKTTMMEQLKKTSEDKKMFDWIVKAVIGQKTNMYSIQQAVAEYMGQSLSEMSVAGRADRLRITFGKMSEGKKKVLVILDDLWETIELKDIGLSPLPNGFKLLLTSRHENICTQIAEEGNLLFQVVRVDVMEEVEAQNFFWEIVGVLKQYNKDFNQIGSEIVRRCGNLPLAIKLIATTLKSQEMFVWRNTLHRLKKNELDYVQKVTEISYSYIKEEDEKAIFLLCGLFPDDFNIPIEQLTRYAWGLQLLTEVSTIGGARDRTKTCVQNLNSANLFMDSDYIGCIKMHDLVLAFVVGRVSTGDHPWLINHGDISKWSRAGMSESCTRISATCSGMSEFPRDLRYPNVSLLRLTDGDKSLSFAEDFYERMENLQVVAYEKMQYPLLPRSLQCSTKLRTLVLHQCLLMFDCSVIGELLNLEVLSLAHCGIRKLPSAIGNLKELKLLDLTGCVNLLIDVGVLKNMVKLEELYMRTANREAIRFTDGNRAELAQLSDHLYALEVEFFETNRMPENMSFMKLERFKISMGHSLGGIQHVKTNSIDNMLVGDNTGFKMHSFENTLVLITNKDELLESRINELFERTEMLYLEVHGIHDIEEVMVKSVSVHHHRHSFYNLSVLEVFKCVDLRYLFTVAMANGLMKLEHLIVSQCPLLQVLAHSDVNDGAGVIKFQELKFLYLDTLPEFIGFSNTVNVIELPKLVELRLESLPNFTSIYAENTSATSSMSSNISEIQPFFKKGVLIPKLEILKVDSMNNLKEIFPSQVSSSHEVTTCTLKKITLCRCDNIVNLFPRNPMSLLRHLEELIVAYCGSIEALFNIDTSCFGETEEYNSNLRYIFVSQLGKLRELWNLKCESSSDILIRSFQVERIAIDGCESFVNVFTPIAIDSDARALMNVTIDGRRPWEERGSNIELVRKSQEINVFSKEEISHVYDDIRDVAFPVHRLKELSIYTCKAVDVVFEIDSSSGRYLTTAPHIRQALLIPYLKDLSLAKLERMSHVWKCNWNKLVIPQNQSQSSFHNLTTIQMRECHSIKYLFSPLMGKLLPNLKGVRIEVCDGIEEVVSNRYDVNDDMATSLSTHTNTISFPQLDNLYLNLLPCLKIIDGGKAPTSGITVTTASIHDQFKCSQVSVASWFLCQYSKKISIGNCPALSRVFPSCVVGDLHKLEELRISGCKSMTELFESDNTCTTRITIPRSENMNLLKLPNLTILTIYYCDLLDHIFTSSTLESLKQLTELRVQGCTKMQVIVKEDGREHTGTSESIVFPSLRSLALVNLPTLKGFFLGMNEFRWPLLDKVNFYGCPLMMVFTSGHSMTPKLNHIYTGFGKHNIESGLNFHLTETQLRSCLAGDTTKLLQFPWSFSNSVEVDVHGVFNMLLQNRVIFPCNELLNLKNLEKLVLTTDPRGFPRHAEVEEIFEVEEFEEEVANDVNIKTQSVVVFEKLKLVTLDGLPKLTHMWKSSRWIVLNFPNLKKLSITECPLLEHVFTWCMVGSLLQLEELQISNCQNMEVIVKQGEDSETRPTEVVFPCLESITLHNLPNLKGFCLANEAFIWPSLDTLEVKHCPKITVFTSGQSITPELKLIDTTFGLCHAMEDPNSFINTKSQEGWQF